MRILAIDSALARCSAGLVIDDHLISVRERTAERGQAAILPVMAAEVLTETGLVATALDLVAVTVGPGSFTGIRAGLALAHGVALASDIPVIGLTVGEAFAEALPRLGVRKLWSAIDSRRGRVFLECDGAIRAWAFDDIPQPDGPVAIAGDAAIEVAARLAARDADVMLTDVRLPQSRHIAVAARRRAAGELPPLPPQPLYIDPPAARLPLPHPRHSGERKTGGSDE